MFKKYGFSALALIVALASAAFTAPVKTPPTTYFFEYLGAPGNEQSPSSWQYLPGSQPACGKPNDGCLIEVNSAYTAPSGTTRVITAASVPVKMVDSHKNPTKDNNDIIVSASNKNN